MHLTMVTGFFQYQICELVVSNHQLHISMDDKDSVIAVTEIKGAVLTRGKNGSNRLELTTKNDRFEFLLTNEQNDEEMRSLIYEMTKEKERIEFHLS